jgi:hypothetical protein
MEWWSRAYSDATVVASATKLNHARYVIVALSQRRRRSVIMIGMKSVED